MRKIFIYLAAALFLLSCNKELGVAPTYTLTVEVGNERTRALNLESGTIKATWAEGEKVTVRNGSGAYLGTLTAQSSGTSTTLTGTITGDMYVNRKLVLDFLSPAYENQDGTLTGNTTSIDKVCDYATASVKVKSIEGDTVTTDEAHFSNRQAIVRFKIKLKDADVPADEMTITVSGYVPDGPSSKTISVHPQRQYDELYVAIPCYYNTESEALTLSFNVVVMGIPLTKNASMNLKNGGFYRATLSL